MGYLRRRVGPFLLPLLLLLALLPAGCREELPPGLDEAWIKDFSRDLGGKVEAADVVLVGRRKMSLGEKGRISLYEIREVFKGAELIRQVMAAYPDVPGSVTVAYLTPRQGVDRHQEPKGKTLIFLTRPLSAGKNMHLLGDHVDVGMIHALPALVDETRRLCAVRSADSLPGSPFDLTGGPSH